MSVTPPGASLTCPRCESALIAGPEGKTFSCASCHGAFVRRAILEALLGEHAALGGTGSYRVAAKAFELPSNPRGSGAYEPDFKYLACPLCGATMNRQNFMKRSGVIVDQCLEHGTWFDRGEIDRAAAFLASGWRPPDDDAARSAPPSQVTRTSALLDLFGGIKPRR